MDYVVNESFKLEGIEFVKGDTVGSRRLEGVKTWWVLRKNGCDTTAEREGISYWQDIEELHKKGVVRCEC